MPLNRPAWSVALSALLFLSIGPAHSEDRWRSAGSKHGEWLDTLHPSAGSTLYSKQGPLWRSDDEGRTWRWIADQDFAFGVFDLSAHPTNPEVLATGYFDGDLKLMISTDGGEQWRPAPGPEDQVVPVGFGHDGALYVSWTELYRSYDLGATWQKVDEAERADRHPEITPTQMGTSIHYRSRGVFQYSLDGGRSFRALSSNATDNGIDPLYISRLDPQRVAYRNGGIRQTLRFSRDGGRTFSEFTAAGSIETVQYHPARREHLYLVVDSGMRDPLFYATDDGGLTWNSREVVGLERESPVWLDPCDASTLYGRTQPLNGLMRSLDAGATWQALAPQQEGWIEEMIGFSESCSFLVRTRAGLYRVTDRGSRWHRDGRGLSGPLSSGFVFDPSDSNRIYSLAAGGIDRSEDQGRTWRRLENELAGSRVHRLSVDRQGVVTAAARGSLFRSVDGGQSFAQIQDDYPWSDFALDPFDSSHVLVFVASADDGIWWESTDGGVSLDRSITVESNGESLPLAHLKFDPYRRGVVYGFVDRTGQFVVSRDSGQSFQIEGSVDEIWQWSDFLEIDVAADGTLVAWVEGRPLAGFQRSTDGGKSWSRQGTDFSYLFNVQTDVGSSDILYAAGSARELDPDVRIWRSADGGATWQAWDEGLRKNGGTTIAQSEWVPDLFLTSTDMGIFRRMRSEAGPCEAADEVLCVRRQRYEIEVEWTDFAGNVGRSKLVPGATDDSGLLYFFDPGNWEMLVKVLDGCAVNERWWVFASATTTVDYTLTVRDRSSGKVRHYINPLGRQAPAIVDTRAFDTCGY